MLVSVLYAAEENNFISKHLIIVFFFLMYIMYGKVYDGFLVSYNRISEMIYSQILAFLITDGISYIIICLMAGHLMWLVPGLFCIVGQVVVASIWSVIAHKFGSRMGRLLVLSGTMVLFLGTMILILE
jgi:hypothetical protein